MKNLSFLSLSILLLSCGNDPSTEKKILSVPVNTIRLSDQQALIKKIKTLDTLTPLGNSLTYSLDTSNKIVITVQNKHYHRSYKSSQFSEPGMYVFKNEWKNFIGLQNKCGPTCWTLAVIPLTKKGRLCTYDYDLVSDAAGNRLLCKKHFEGNVYYVMNIETGKKKVITLAGLSGQGFIGSGIDSVVFVKNGMYVKWEVSGGSGKNGKTKTEVFKLNI
jgi:hypothetical protein